MNFNAINVSHNGNNTKNCFMQREKKTKMVDLIVWSLWCDCVSVFYFCCCCCCTFLVSLSLSVSFGSYYCYVWVTYINRRSFLCICNRWCTVYIQYKLGWVWRVWQIECFHGNSEPLLCFVQGAFMWRSHDTWNTRCSLN